MVYGGGIGCRAKPFRLSDLDVVGVVLVALLAPFDAAVRARLMGRTTARRTPRIRRDPPPRPARGWTHSTTRRTPHQTPNAHPRPLRRPLHN